MFRFGRKYCYVFETKLSDFYKLTTTVLKQYFSKFKPKVVNYRDYRKLRKDEYRAELDKKMLKHDINNMDFKQAYSYETNVS